MNWMKSVLSVSVLSLCVVSVGCRSPKMPLTPAQQGAVVGGAAGGGAGALWAQHAHDSTINSWQGAGAGLVAGALTGALIGDALDEYAYDNGASSKDKDALINDLQRQLAGLDNVKVESVNGQIRFTILNEVLFESGKAELKQSSKATLDSVMDIIQREYASRDITIEGHTDSDPIQKSKWKDNWELSYNRSIAVLYYLMNEKQIVPERLKAVACGESQPIVANDTNENKRLNRRAVIVVMPAKDSIIVEKK
jgi:chemotaxis protein MotB